MLTWLTQVTIAKAKDQEELDKQTNLVVGFVSNFFSSYKHISENQAKFFAAQVALALAHLHGKGIIYRDLKPENVLVGEDGKL